MTGLPTTDQQEAAWVEYIGLKRRTDEAFERFKELYLAEDHASGRIVDHPRPDNVKIFPVHRTRESRLIAGAAS
jgi:hypothetical protein